MSPTKPNKSVDAATKANDVINAEKEYLKKDDKLSALAISGGGIRSASFGLGVMQGLVKFNILQEIDYISSVSGGGYISAALTWFLKKGIPDRRQKDADGNETKELMSIPASTNKVGFPLGKKGSAGRYESDGNVLDFIRQHGNYLTPGFGLNAVSLFAVALRSMFISLVVYIALLTIIMVLLVKGYIIENPFTPETEVVYYIPGTEIHSMNGWVIPFALLIMGIIAFLYLSYSVRSRFSKAGAVSQYKWFVWGQKAIGFLWIIVVCSLFIGSLPYVKVLLGEAIDSQLTAAGISTILGSLAGYLQFDKATKGGDSKSGGLTSGLIIYVGSFLLIYGILLLSFVLATNYFISWPWFFGLVAGFLFFAIFTNLNYNGLNRMWRDRLMEAYMPNSKNVLDNAWGPATDADKGLMKDMCGTDVHGEDKRRPYHLINTNIVLVDSDVTKYRSRGGDSFLISRLYCGSDATTYRATDKYMVNVGGGMTLASAVSISSAAVNPDSAVSGEGVTRGKLVSILLNLLNLRLGYWAPNPKKSDKDYVRPNFLVPALSSQLTGIHENNHYVELTDGGHFENLAVYELIRRKASFIILSDGGADETFKFDDLSNLVERIRVDFGANIRFRNENEIGKNPKLAGTKPLGLAGLLPGSGKGPLTKKFQLAKRGFAVADIEYLNGGTGVLLYLKLTVTDGMPADIYGYKGANPDFPAQSTADQFFDEKQFEAYRELGYQLCKQMFRNEAVKKETEQNLGITLSE